MRGGRWRILAFPKADGGIEFEVFHIGEWPGQRLSRVGWTAFDTWEEALAMRDALNEGEYNGKKTR